MGLGKKKLPENNFSKTLGPDRDGVSVPVLTGNQ